MNLTSSNVRIPNVKGIIFEVFVHYPLSTFKAMPDDDVLRRFAAANMDRCCCQMTKILEICNVSELSVRYSLMLEIAMR